MINSIIDSIKRLVLISLIIVLIALCFVFFITFIFSFFTLLIGGRQMRNDLKDELPKSVGIFDRETREEGLKKIKNWCIINNRRYLFTCIKILSFDRYLLIAIFIWQGIISFYCFLFFR